MKKNFLFLVCLMSLSTSVAFAENYCEYGFGTTGRSHVEFFNERNGQSMIQRFRAELGPDLVVTAVSRYGWMNYHSLVASYRNGAATFEDRAGYEQRVLSVVGTADGKPFNCRFDFAEQL